MQYTEEGFVVLKGSVGRLQSVRSIQETTWEQFRQSLLDTQVVKSDGEVHHLSERPPVRFTECGGAVRSPDAVRTDGWLGKIHRGEPWTERQTSIRRER